MLGMLVNLQLSNIGLLLLLVLRLWTNSIQPQWRNILKQPFFWLSLLYFLLYIWGWIRSEDKLSASFAMEKKMGLIAIPALLLSFNPLPTKYLHWFFTLFIGGTISLLNVALIIASLRYFQWGGSYVFFYHNLVEPVGITAIQASAYTFISIIFLFQLKSVVGIARILLAGYLICCLLLLSSKMAIGILLIISVCYIFLTKRSGQQIALMVAIGISTAFILNTDNPIKSRFNEITQFSTKRVLNQQFSASDYFDGLSMRAIFVRFGVEILNQEQAWLLGLGTGDAEHRLKEKISTSGMYIGKQVNEHDMGYLEYSFHNQYLQILCESGFVGLFIFCTWLCFAWIKAIKNQSYWILCLLLFFTVSFFSESWLESQMGLFLLTILICISLKLPKLNLQ
jgi:O-antigen ligase